VERNPVCLTDLAGKGIHDVYKIILTLPDQSIYDSCRLALPDEVWNFRRGDGIEKAFLLADYIISCDKEALITVDIDKQDVSIKYNDQTYRFESTKDLKKVIKIQKGLF